MGFCITHNWRGPIGYGCPECIAERNQERRHAEQLQVQNEQYLEQQRRQDQIIEQERQLVQLELERDIDVDEAFARGNKFDPYDSYLLTENGVLEIFRFNPYLRLPLKEAFDKGVAEYRKRNFSPDPGKDYMISQAREIGLNLIDPLIIRKKINNNIEFTLHVGGIFGEKSHGYEVARVNGKSVDVLMRISDGELLPDFTLSYVHKDIAKAYFDGVKEALKVLNTPEMKIQRLNLRQSKNVSEAINQRKYQEKIKEANAAYELERQRAQTKEILKNASSVLAIVIIFIIIPIVWFMGGWAWGNFGIFGWPALGVAIALFLYH